MPARPPEEGGQLHPVPRHHVDKRISVFKRTATTTMVATTRNTLGKVEAAGANALTPLRAPSVLPRRSTGVEVVLLAAAAGLKRKPGTTCPLWKNLRTMR